MFHQDIMTYYLGRNDTSHYGLGSVSTRTYYYKTKLKQNVFLLMPKQNSALSAVRPSLKTNPTLPPNRF